MKLHQTGLLLFLLLSILFKPSHGNAFGEDEAVDVIDRDKGGDENQDEVDKELEGVTVKHHGPASIDLSFIVLRPNDHDNQMIVNKIYDLVHTLNDVFKYWFEFTVKFLFFIIDEHCYKQDLIRQSDHSPCNTKLFSYKQGDCDTLNYFIVGDVGHYDDAWGYYPWRCNKHPGTDSVWFKDSFITGAILAETGAWFGLLYTWGYWHDNNGCHDENDFVGDTAPSKTYYHSYFDKHAKCYQEFSCGHGYKDAIENYMGPANPSCRKEFTSGQYHRAWRAFHYYRREYTPPHHRALRHPEEE